jgi:hypothetical protein
MGGGLVVYQNLTKTRTFKVEARRQGYAVVESRQGRKPKVMGTYPTRSDAERELSLFAYDGFRRIE